MAVEVALHHKTSKVLAVVTEERDHMRVELRARELAEQAAPCIQAQEMVSPGAQVNVPETPRPVVVGPRVQPAVAPEVPSGGRPLFSS